MVKFYHFRIPQIHIKNQIEVKVPFITTKQLALLTSESIQQYSEIFLELSKNLLPFQILVKSTSYRNYTHKREVIMFIISKSKIEIIKLT